MDLDYQIVIIKKKCQFKVSIDLRHNNASRAHFIRCMNFILIEKDYSNEIEGVRMHD